jgi:hypothetical protein
VKCTSYEAPHYAVFSSLPPLPVPWVQINSLINIWPNLICQECFFFPEVGFKHNLNIYKRLAGRTAKRKGNGNEKSSKNFTETLSYSMQMQRAESREHVSEGRRTVSYPATDLLIHM